MIRPQRQWACATREGEMGEELGFGLECEGEGAIAQIKDKNKDKNKLLKRRRAAALQNKTKTENPKASAPLPHSKIKTKDKRQRHTECAYYYKTQTRIHFAFLVLVLVGWGVPTCSFAQGRKQDEKRVVPFEGTQAFQHLLHLAKLEPMDGYRDLREIPADQTVIVVLGDPKPLAKIQRTYPGGLRGFLDRGGALLVATERSTPPEVEDSLHLRVDGKTLLREQWQGEYYSFPECPMVRVAPGRDHPIVKGCERIATNVPSWISYDSWRGWNPLGAIQQPGALPDPRSQDALMVHRKFIGGSHSGRALVVSGQGLFINGMMVQDDTDNFRFAYNCVNWLSDDGKRHRVLFIEEGTVRESLDVPLAVAPPSVVPSVALTNKILNSIQKNVNFNELILRKAGHGLIIVSLFFSLGLFALVRLIGQLSRFRHKPQHHVPLSEKVLSRKTTPAPPLALRNQEMYDQKNLREPIRHLLRHWFGTLDGSEGTPNHKPRVWTNHMLTRWVWQLRVNYLWDLAYGGKPRKVSPKQFQRVLGMMEALDDAQRDGSLRLTI